MPPDVKLNTFCFMIQFVPKQYKNTASEYYGRYYAYPVIYETIDLEGLAKHMAEHNSGFSEPVCIGVMKCMVKCAKEMVLEGKNVKINDLAIFSCGIVNVPGGAESDKDFRASTHIKGIKLRARATGELSNANLNLWGTPPFVTSVLAGDALPYNCDKDPENPMSHEDLILWVAKECEEAAADLDERKSTADVDGAVRVTKGFAWALAGKAYLFAGKYDQAKANLKKVIDSGKYALVPGDRYMDNFHIEGDGNEEKVFEINFEYNAGKGGWSGMIQRSSWMEANAWNWRAGNFVTSPNKVYCGGLDGWGGLGVPQWFGDEFFANDGHSYRFDATLKHIDDAVYNMEYIDQSINNMSLEEKKASKKIGIKDPTQGLYGNSFWLAFKQIIRAADTGGKVYGDNIRLNNYIIMRYAEVLLNYAEACIQTGDAATAKTVINQIQQRAGSKTISASVDMEVLKREKSYELWLESCRWFDIMRWNDQTALARLEKVGTDVPHLFDKLFRTPSSSDRSVKWENGSEANSRFYTVSSSEAKDKGFDVGFKKGKHELFPFPQTVMDKNPNLEQNPGW